MDFYVLNKTYLKISSILKLTETMPPTFGASGLVFVLINIHLTLYPCFINDTNKSTKNNNRIVNYEVLLKKSLKKFIEYKR